jgi:hypothetical protein
MFNLPALFVPQIRVIGRIGMTWRLLNALKFSRMSALQVVIKMAGSQLRKSLIKLRQNNTILLRQNEQNRRCRKQYPLTACCIRGAILRYSIRNLRRLVGLDHLDRSGAYV